MADMAEAGVDASPLRASFADRTCVSSSPWLELTDVDVDFASEEHGLQQQVRKEDPSSTSDLSMRRGVTPSLIESSVSSSFTDAVSSVISCSCFRREQDGREQGEGDRKVAERKLVGRIKSSSISYLEDGLGVSRLCSLVLTLTRDSAPPDHQHARSPLNLDHFS
eukprot:764106-Hanusia_phi.AAC.9